MTMCDKMRPRLTAYLDGDLADEQGSVVRGHLRECAACRQTARDEAALRDGLRMLAPIDPPQALWAGIQVRLAAAEVADARKPRWRRVVERPLRWVRAARFTPTLSAPAPHLAVATVVALAAIAILTWRAHRDEPSGHVVVSRPDDANPPDPASRAPTGPRVARAPSAALSTAPAGDVTEELRAEPARTTASYDRAIEELMKLAAEDSVQWSADARAAFHVRIDRLRDAIAHATPGRAARRAQGSMIRYLQTAVARDDVLVASASGGAP
jgi:hypothetical protein